MADLFLTKPNKSKKTTFKKPEKLDFMSESEFFIAGFV